MPDLVPTGEQSTAGLLEDWPEYDECFDPINRVFLPRADIATETLAAGLVELGWEVDDVTAYRTVRAAPPPAAIREAIKGGGFDAVLFTSSSTVRNLVGIAGKPHASTVVAVHRAGRRPRPPRSTACGSTSWPRSPIVADAGRGARATSAPRAGPRCSRPASRSPSPSERKPTSRKKVRTQ